MKRLSTIIMALALVLGMSQCKKQETPTTGNTTPIYPGVDITVKVGDNEGKAENGEKHHIAPNYGLFAFSDGDKLYVGHGGKFVGSLKFKNGFFSGTINPNPNVTEQPLHFFFLGNSELKSDTIVNQTTSLSISIADQSGNLPVLSYGASTKNFTGAGTTYSTTLKNKCALVKFNLQNQGLVENGFVVTLSGVPTLATVNFANPTAETAIVATEGQTNGDITLYSEDGVSTHRWAILLPGTNLSTGHGDLNTNSYSGNVNLGALGTNDYVNSGISINNPKPAPAAPKAKYAVVKTSDSTLTKFSVSGDKEVYFSKANLRYDESSGVWSFHDNQFDGCIGYVTGSYPQGYNVSPNGTKMDRFSWGFQYPTTTGESDYVDGSRNLNRTDGTDWGCALTGEGNNNWRTLTSAEWNYLLNNKTGVRGDNRFMKVTIGTLNITDPNTNTTYNELYLSGLFIAPDNFDPSKYSFTSSFANKTWNNSTCQGINITDANTLLAAGCVFLPALGYRDENGYQDWYYYSGSPTNTNFAGYYWSATGVQQNPGLTPQAEALKFTRTANTMPSNNAQFRNLGMCVRLVWDAN